MSSVSSTVHLKNLTICLVRLLALLKMNKNSICTRAFLLQSYFNLIYLQKKRVFFLQF